jgi:hypothetical protein
MHPAPFDMRNSVVIAVPGQTLISGAAPRHLQDTAILTNAALLTLIPSVTL